MTSFASVCTMRDAYSTFPNQLEMIKSCPWLQVYGGITRIVLVFFLMLWQSVLVHCSYQGLEHLNSQQITGKWRASLRKISRESMMAFRFHAPILCPVQSEQESKLPSP